VILAIDTTGAQGSLALLRNGIIIEETTLVSSDGYAHVLYDHLKQLLNRNGCDVRDITCFAAGSGPGSFTGVRVGLAAAKGLAEAIGARVAPVSNMKALAWFGSAPLRSPVIAAGRGEVYAAVYDAGGNIVVPEVVTTLTPWLESLSAEVEVIHRGQAPPLARAIGAIAAQMLSSGQTVDPAAVDANYVRRSDAELFWKDAQ